MQRRILHAVVAMLIGAAVAIVQGLLTPAPVIAHGGELDSRGCHNDRQRGGYHCRRGLLAEQSFVSATEAIAALARLKTATPLTTTAPVAQAAPTPPATPSDFCDLDRRLFETLVSIRMQTYESTGDSWSPRAARWRNEIAGNIAAGRGTISLDATFSRYSRYCSEGNSFMAGVVVGEWVGIGLGAP